MTALTDRAGKNAALKPFSGALAGYGSHRSYVIDQTKGHQIVIPGPPLPGSGSKNRPPRAQDTEGQFDLGQEKYMGARSRQILGFGQSLGLVYGISGVVTGTLNLVRANGKAIEIGDVTAVAPDAVLPAVYNNLLNNMFCLAPGEDIVYIPDVIAPAGTALFVPNFIDGDLINHRVELSTAKQNCMLVPPGKVWETPQGLNASGTAPAEPFAYDNLGILNLNAAVQTVDVYINPGNGAADIRFTGAGGLACGAGQFTPILFGGAANLDSFFLPAGHSIKAALRAAAADVFFCAVVAEHNQAHIGDEAFTQASVVDPIDPP